MHKHVISCIHVFKILFTLDSFFFFFAITFTRDSVYLRFCLPEPPLSGSADPGMEPVPSGSRPLSQTLTLLTGRTQSENLHKTMPTKIGCTQFPLLTKSFSLPYMPASCLPFYTSQQFEALVETESSPLVRNFQMFQES